MTRASDGVHHFSLDLEEYFHPTPMERWVPPDRWDSLPRRSPKVVPEVLRWLDEHGARATFFVLGWLAEREPRMVKSISDAGHEIASHGWGHRLVTRMDPEEFRTDVRRTKSVLEDLVGQPVIGYRAPSFSIVPGQEWTFEVLVEEGYLYDSSLFPVGIHPTYGFPCDRDPHLRISPAGPLIEIPPSTVRMLRTNLPAAGGAYLRYFPYALIRTAFLQANERGAPGTFYIHPWELDNDSPQVKLPWVLRMRVRGGLGNVSTRVRRLLSDFRFRPMGDTARTLGAKVQPADDSVAPSEVTRE